MANATRILNLARLQRNIRRLPQAARARIKAAMEVSADEIVRLAKSLAPVSPENGGTLRDSIGWTWGKPPRGSITLGKVAESALGADLTITIYAGNDEAFYARWVEFGTKAAKAQPFFYPSYRANKKRVSRRIKRAVTLATRDVASS